MKRRVLLYTIALLLISQPAIAQTPSRVPPDVVLDYSYDAVHLMNGVGAALYVADERYKQFLERLRQFPSDILIVGKEAPFTHSFGPTLSFGGENNTFPRVFNRSDEEPRRLLSPDELRLRIKAIERFVRDVHGAGVKAVLPYISPMTMFGEPEKRLGFFAFYDHWDQYESAFNLGTRPPGDPLEWSQVDPQGRPFFRFGQKSMYKPLIRYSMCINAPGWRQWLQVVTRWISRVGYNGVWMDNVVEHRCHCSDCHEVTKEIGGDMAPHQIDLGLRALHPFWLESYLRYFDELRNEGVPVLAVNYLEIPFQRAVTDKVDLAMIEHSWLGIARLLWSGGVWTGFYPPMPDLKVQFDRTQGTSEARALQNLWLVQLAYAMRGERGTHFLYGAPAKGRAPEFAHNENSALLALAEGAAFGGGVAVHVVGSGNSPFLDDNDLPAHRARQRFFAFARQHREVYDGLLPAGDVALVVFPEQAIEALLEAQQVHETLLWRGILVDVLNGDTVNEALLRRYRLVIVPGQTELPSWMKHIPLLRSPAPITRGDWKPVAKAYQQKRKMPRLRQTKLAELAVQRVNGLRAVALPEGSLVQASTWANNQRTILHLLNYQVPIGRDNGNKVKEVQNIAVHLYVPQGKQIKQVQLYVPSEDHPKALVFQQSRETLTFTVPLLQVYAICEVLFH